MANHLISLPSKACQKQGGLPSIGITQFQRYYAPLRLPPGSEPVVSVAGHDPAPGTGLPRYPSYLSGMLSPIPRWIKTGGSVTSLSCFGLPRILGGSASTTFLSGPAQGSLAVTACRIAAALSAYIFPQGFSRMVSQSHCLGSYRDEPTISRAELPSAGNLRPRGAPTSCGRSNSGNFRY